MNEDIQAVAARLEELTIIAKTIVDDLREDAVADTSRSRMAAYARMYYLRRELSKQVAKLGYNAPYGISRVADYYEKLV